MLDQKTIETSCYESSNAFNQAFALPNKKGRLVIEFTGYDLLAPGTLSMTIPDGTIVSGRVYAQPLESPIEQSPNVIYDYLETYRRARDQAQAEEEAAKELKNE